MKITYEMVKAGSQYYVEGGCCGLTDYEREEVVESILHAALDKAHDELEIQNSMWQKNSRDAFDAMVAMRNSINEHIPMPSLDSDLLNGPESSVFCSTVAESIIKHVIELEAQLASYEFWYGDRGPDE